MKFVASNLRLEEALRKVISGRFFRGSRVHLLRRSLGWRMMVTGILFMKSYYRAKQVWGKVKKKWCNFGFWEYSKFL